MVEGVGLPPDMTEVAVERQRLLMAFSGCGEISGQLLHETEVVEGVGFATRSVDLGYSASACSWLTAAAR